MARKRKATPPTKEADNFTTTATVEPPVETQVEVPPVQSQPVEAQVVDTPAVENPSSFVERLGDRHRRPSIPDPFLIASDNLAGARLFESKRDRVMAIGFNERPIQAVLDLVKQAGFRWNPQEFVWMRAISPDSVAASRIEAERLYQQACQMIRQEKGTDTGQDIPF